MSVCRSVGLSVCWSVGPAFAFWHFASSFCITAPAQLHATDAVMCTAPPTAPAHHITAPAQPQATDGFVYTALLTTDYDVISN